MPPIWPTLLLVGTMAALFLLVVAAFIRVWLSYRLRTALLQRCERGDIVQDSAQLDALIEAAAPPGAPQDFAVTGAFLAVFGLLAYGGGRILGVGQLAVGLYTGGMACVALATVLGGIGIVLRRFDRAAGIRRDRSAG